MADLRISGLTKSFGGRTVVDGIDLTVAEGEMLVVLGPSGCGKTTTLRMVCGLEKPDSGSIRVGDKELTTLPPRERNLGMVFQEYGLYPTMDVSGNMAYGLQARRSVKPAEIEQRVRRAAEQLGLTGLLKRPIGALSGGEQQRVALGRALVKDADAYLFDEPLSNLDPKLRFTARRDILAVHRMKGRPSLYITHDQTEALALADRIAVMAQGRLQQVGKPEELLTEPANVFVAGFVGSPPWNLLPALVKRADTGPAVLAGGIVVPLGADGRRALDRHPGGDVVAGLRPDALTLARGDRPGLAASVTGIEPLIGETVVTVALDGGQGERVVALMRDAQANALAVGDRVELAVDEDGVRLFDAASGQALTR